MIMENFDDAVFEDDEFIDGEQDPQGTQKTNSEPPQEPSEEQGEDFTSEVLRLKGISDPSKIKFEDESGTIIERSWDSLSKEEQLNILVNDEEEDNQLDDGEIELINQIRSSGMKVQDYLNSIQEQVQPADKQYKIDSLSDEDVYALDLIEKVGSENITDEEITKAVEVAKQNEDLFKKTVDGLRKEYKRLQENEEEQLAKEQEAKYQAEYQKFANSIQNEIRGLNSFAGRELELSNDDIEDLSDFILNIDESGMSAFGKAMNDPALFTKAAFWILNEDKIVEELTKQIQDSYKKGYEMAKQDLTRSNPSKLVFTKPSSKEQKVDTSNFVEDDEWW